MAKAKKTLLILIGKTLSGKTTIVNNLVNNHGNHIVQLRTSTTRPKRPEEDPKAYHFIDDDYIAKHQDDVIAPRTYHVIQGNHQNTWTYFLDQIELQTFIQGDPIKMAITILDFPGAVELNQYIIKHHLPLNVQAVYLDIPLDIRLKRAVNTERNQDDVKETLRRLYYDEFKDFKKLDNLDATLINKKYQLQLDKFTTNQAAYEFIEKLI